MTKKHFEKIATAFKAYVEQTPDIGIQRGVLRGLATDLCDIFREDNPKFDKDRFMQACGF